MTELPQLTRRGLLAGGAALAGAVVAATSWPAASAATGQSLRLSLPAPTGTLHIGRLSLRLVDRTRIDPLAPSPRARELMVHLWYPARASQGPAARYLPGGVAQIYTDLVSAASGTSLPADLLTFRTHGGQAAPALPGVRCPVVLFSPGFGLNAAIYTGLHEELASRGYIVVGIDHTFDATAVEFPGGRVETQPPESPDLDFLRTVRVGDTRFVLDRLVARGHTLPHGLGQMLGMSRIAAFGHSLGSLTVVTAMEQDNRIDAGAALDGNPLGGATLRQPFLMMGNPGHLRANDPDWAAFYDRLRGPRRHLVIDGTEHADFSDVTVFKAAVDVSALFSVGPIDGLRAVEIQRAYLTAWFDQTLLSRQSALLRGESPAFPEVDFQP